MRIKAADLLFICSPRLNQLQILRMIAANPHLTQAALSAECGLSVSMVNNYMKELCEAGLIEYRRKSTKNVSYHLTSLGRAQLESMESELTGDAIARFAKTKERLLERILALCAGIPSPRVVLFGTGHLSELVFHALARSEIGVIGVCDDSRPIGSRWCGCEILNPRQLVELAPDAVIITDWGHADEIWNRLEALLPGHIRLIRLDRHSPAAGSGRVTRHPSPGSKPSIA
jgi:DNA-binding MarR family transcriptional regulator